MLVIASGEQRRHLGGGAVAEVGTGVEGGVRSAGAVDFAANGVHADCGGGVDVERVSDGGCGAGGAGEGWEGPGFGYDG